MSDFKLDTMEQLAKKLQYSTQTITAWVRSGAIPPHTYIHEGSSYRFDTPEVIKALKERNRARMEASQSPNDIDEDAPIQESFFDDL